MEEEIYRRKTKKLKLRIAVIIIAVVLVVGGLATGIGIYVSNNIFNESDIAVFVNDESSDSYSVYAGSSTIKLVPKLKNKTTGFSVSYAIENADSECTIDEAGNFTPGLKACDTTVRISVSRGKKTVNKKVVITIKDRGLKSIDASYVPKNSYVEGQRFETNGLIITGLFEIGMSTVTSYELSNSMPLVPENTSITIRYTENGVTVSTEIPITVAPKTLQGVRITEQPAQTEYIEGDTFKTDGMKVIALYEYISVPIFDYSISKISPLTLNDKAIYISHTEGDITKFAAVEIEVKEKSLQSISVTHNPNKTDYVEGQIFDATGLEITANFEFMSFIVSDYELSNTTYLSEADTNFAISYTYRGITKSTEVILNIEPKTLQGLTINTPPDKVKYIEGERFDTTGLSVVAEYDYFSEQTTDFIINPDRQLLPTDTEIELSFSHRGISKSQTISITVEPKTLQRITVSTLPTKTTYIEGQTFDESGMVVTAHYEFVDSEITDYSIDVADKLLIGNEAVTVSYTENGVTKTAAFVLTITGKTLQRLTLTKLPNKLSYTEGQVFDNTGAIITAEYEYLSYDVTKNFYNFKTPLMPTDTEIVYSFTDGDITKTVAVDISVAERTLKEIEITRQPDTVAYIEGDTFDSSGLIITAVYEYKSLQVQDFTVDTVTPLSLSDSVRTISYTENGVTKTVDLELIISANVLEYLIIDSSAAKTVYSAGECLNTNGLKVFAYYTNETYKPVTGWRTDKTESPLLITDTVVNVSYTDINGNSRVTKTARYDISVIERELINIEITALPNKLHYVVGEFFDSNGLVVTAYYNGNQSQIVSDYSLSLTGKVLGENDDCGTIIYKENTITKVVVFDISVSQRVLTSLEIVSEPNKTNYKNTEKFDATGLVVVAVYNDGAYSKTVSNYTIDNAGLPLSTGDEFISISYTENAVTKKAEIAINVTARTLTAIEITSPAYKLNYIEGEYFDILGLSVTAHYEDAEDSIITTWTYDKSDRLTIDDNTIFVSYTEDDIKKTTQFDISVVAPTITDEAILNVISVIDALPNMDELTLENEGAVSYANSLYEALETEKQSKVNNYNKLLTATKKIAELLEELPPYVEPKYNISYLLYGEIDFIDISMGNNPTEYQNSDGAIALNNASSEVATLSGYVFIGWIDSDDFGFVTQICNLAKDKIYYAAFELTETVNIKFIDYDDKATELYSLSNVSRVNADGNYSYPLTDDISETIKSIANKIVVGYYLLEEHLDTTFITDALPTDYAATIIVYVKVVSLREVKLENELDASLSWIYSYIDDDNISRSEYHSYNGEANYCIPIGAKITLFANNPLLVDFLIDGKRANMLYPSRDYSFLLEEEKDVLTIGYQYNQMPTTTITFSGINTKIFTFDNETWDGHLNVLQLNEIEFIFDEDNYSYLNIYELNGLEYYFSELRDLLFSEDVLINVKRIENKFNLRFVYSGGMFTLSNLKGRQTLEEAICENGLSTGVSAVYDAIWSKLSVYQDYNYSNIIDRKSVEAGMLLSDITLYIAERRSFDLIVANYDLQKTFTVNVASYNENASFNLRDVLYGLERSGYLVNGISLTDGGEIITDIYIDVVLQNINTQANIFVNWTIDPTYMEPLPEVDYSGYTNMGSWSATYNNRYGLISADFTFEPDGTFSYITYVNGNESANMSGEYRIVDNEIVIHSLKLKYEYQIIPNSMLKVNNSYINDNILIVPMFIIDDLSVTAYDHVLTKGEVRPANYLQNEILGQYTRHEVSLEENVRTEKLTVINFYANGTAFVTTKLNGLTILSANGYYRVTGNRIFFMSNSDFGVFDFGEMQDLYIKEGQDYSSINSVGYWIATNNESWEFSELVEISSDGIIMCYIGENGIGANFNIINSKNYAVVINMPNGLCSLEIELINGFLCVVMNNIADGTTGLFVFEKA